jgi:hypothetical protein
MRRSPEGWREKINEKRRGLRQIDRESRNRTANGEERRISRKRKGDGMIAEEQYEQGTR